MSHTLTVRLGKDLAAYDAIDTAQNADLVFRVKNSDRSVGATVAVKGALYYE